MDEWISVSERLPEVNGRYLVYSDYLKECEVGEWSVIMQNWDLAGENYYDADDFDYWMPLPDLPEPVKPHIKDIDPVELKSFIWRVGVACGFPWQDRKELVAHVDMVLDRS